MYKYKQIIIKIYIIKRIVKVYYTEIKFVLRNKIIKQNKFTSSIIELSIYQFLSKLIIR